MKHIVALCILALCYVLPTAGQQLDAMTNAELLKCLDKVVAEKQQYREQLIHRIDSMKRCAATQPDVMQRETYYNIYREYASLQSDSALAYLDRMEALLRGSQDSDYKSLVQIGRARTLGVMGLYSSALRELREINVSQASREITLLYYQISRAVYGWMADFGELSSEGEHFAKLTQQYRDSILAVQDAGIDRSIIEADACYIKGDAERSLEICKRIAGQGTPQQRCYLFFHMAQAAKALGRVDDEVHYLALAAIYDLQRGITEYSALLKLAMALSEQGDTERAYEYLICTLEDASYGKARLRSFEASEVFPIIERAHNQHVADQKTRHIMLVAGMVCFIIVLLVVLLYLRRKNQALKAVRQELAEAVDSVRNVNEALVSANRRLSDSNKAKEACLARYLVRCRVYMDALDQQRRKCQKMLKAHKIEELMAELKSSAGTAQDEENFYADFDEAFLTIFPDFINNFNALLQPDAQIVPKHEEMLNTELRIFALIRLGINDSNRIAHFLNYSLPTIYSYRSRIRNKSVFSREEFDAKVLEC